METLEQKSKVHTRRTQIENIALGTLATAGTLSMVVFAPNAIQLLKKADSNWLSKRDPRQRLREAVFRLKYKGLIKFEQNGQKKMLCLTEKGKKEVERIEIGTLKIKEPKRWDRKWRIIIFDIRESRKAVREKIRHLVRSLGFYRLQDSVWIYPHSCEEIITLLKTDLKIGRELLYIIADAIEFDQPLRKHFKLPLD